MVKKLHVWLWGCLLFGLTGCIFQNDEFFEPFKTDLRVTVKDIDSREHVPNAQVALFRSKTDFEALSSIEARGQTDENGVAWFKDLEDVNYYIYVAYEKEGVLYDNSTADFNMGQELVDGALTDVELVARPKRPIKPTKVETESLWLMKYENDLDSTSRLGIFFFLYDSLTDDYYEIGETGFYRYRKSNPVSDETHSRELDPEDFSFNLRNQPILYVGTVEIERKGRNDFDTVYVSWDSVSFATYTNRGLFPDRIRIAEWDEITLDLKVNWK